MHLIYEFDIAAFFIELIVIVFYHKRKNIPSLQNRVFMMVVYTLAFTSVMEIATSYIEFYLPNVPVPFQWILECLYYTGTNSWSILYTMYCIAILGLLKKDDSVMLRKKTVLKICFIVPYIFVILVIWLSPFIDSFYPLAFSVRPDTGYTRNYNFWFYMLYAVSFLYIVLGFILLELHKKFVDSYIRKMLYMYILVVAISVFVQLWHYGLNIECFFLSLATLVFFFYIQKPESLIDSNTGIFNQSAFLQIAETKIRKNEKYTCIFILMDDTVFMGNTLGFAQLNSFLQEVGLYLTTNFSYYNVFSLNQECFCVTLNNASEADTCELVDKLQERFKKTWIHDSVPLRLYSRICVVECPEDAKTGTEALDIISMITTDERYKKPLIYANEIDLEDKRRSVYIEHVLRNGLSENRFDVYYQPIYSVSEKTIIGAEALIRLRDEDGYFISPEDFIPIAEKTGSILRIGEFVYESVCRTLSLIDINDYGIKKIHINLSVAQCMQEILAEQILSIQSVYQIPASIINLEITETAAAHTPEILRKNLQSLTDAGFELSLDDYGSGYSNMSYMLNLPFKMIKIDKYIVWAAYADERAELALSATIKMIKSLGMTVLAEGVEEKDQATWLMELGCDYLQGYYYSRPVPKTEFLNIMLDNK